MAMDDQEAQRQINQMVSFILNESRDKAQEIEARALEDFNIEKLKLVQVMKDKIRIEYQKKAKQMEIKRSIARSTAINKARLKKISARDQVLNEVQQQSAQKLATISNDKQKYTQLIIDLIVQGLLRLIEPAVIVKCREIDKDIVESCLDPAAKKYSEILQKECNISKTVKLTLDKSGHYLPPPPSSNESGRTCSGGVILVSADNRITCDNTLDSRLKLVMQECTPVIRRTLFQ